MAITQGTAGSGGGGGGGGVITDVQDGTGDSVMDAANNAVRVNVVTGATSGGSTETTLAAINTAVGATTDAGVVTDTTGTVIAFLRGNIIKWVAMLARIPAALTAGGNFKISIQEQAGTLTVGDGSGSLTVDGTVAVTNANLDAALSTLGTQTTLAAIKAKTDNLDVLLSTRTKAADAQHAIIDSGTVAVTNANLDAALSTLGTQTTLAAILAKIIAAPATEATLALIKAKTDNLDVALSTRTKPADAQHVIVDSTAGTVSTANSSAVTLTSGSVFTGTSEDMSGIASIVVNIFANVAGTFSPQFSSDGTNWDFQGSHAIAAGTGAMFVFRPGTKFFRIVYTNGGTNQTTFRLQTIYHQDQVTTATALSLSAGMVNPTTIQIGADLCVQTGGGTTWAPALADANNRIRLVADGENRVSVATLTRPANTTAYAAGDELTDTGGAILTFTNCGLFNGGGGMITGLTISSSVNAATKPVGEIRFYDTTSTPATDNAAFDSSDGVNDTFVASIPFGLGSDGLTGTTGNSLFDIDGLSKTFKCAGGTTSLFARIILKAAYTSPANSDTLKFTLRIG